MKFPRRSKNASGSAIVVVLVLLVLLSALLVTTSVAVRQLHTELQRIEKIQLKKYAPEPSAPKPQGN